MAWELMNEPQLSNDYDKKMGIPPGSVTTAWVREMASFIREVDGGRHLVSVGDEGWRSDVKGGSAGTGRGSTTAPRGSTPRPTSSYPRSTL